MENIKSKIIPEKLKANIDEVMAEQLFNANRYYAESNPDISNLMNQELFNDPVTFYNRLVDRWNWHNLYYEQLLEPAYIYLIKDNDIELSPKEISDLIAVYSTSCLVDEATLVMSGAIKKYLDYNCNNISIQDENISLFEARQMLITPPIETFFAQYQIDHLYYIYLLKSEDKETLEFKKYLKNKYHANDELIFTKRFEKIYKYYTNKPKNKILEEIQSYVIPSSYKTKHFYFTLEHPDRKAIRDIIIYDNLNEKLIASNFIGISGFLLRKKILEYLNSSKILMNDGYIYEYNNDIIIQSLEKLKYERKNKMEKNIRIYKQRGDTCAIACMMMALEYYKIIEKANWYDERRLYKIYGSQYMSGTPFSALAYHFSKNGLETTIYHSDENLFNNKKKIINEDNFNSAMNEYKEYLERAQSKGTKVVNGMDINMTLVKEKIEEGNIVIIAGEIYGGYHAILISGYDNDKFIVCDPLYKNKQIKSEEELEKFMDTSIGKWFISVNNKTKEKDILMKKLEKFNQDSEKILLTHENRCLRYEKK